MRVVLVGPQDLVHAELQRHSSAARLPIEIVHASEYITMEDKVEAIRAKRDSSMRVGLRMVREGQAAGGLKVGPGAELAIEESRRFHNEQHDSFCRGVRVLDGGELPGDVLVLLFIRERLAEGPFREAQAKIANLRLAVGIAFLGPGQLIQTR